MNRLLIRPLFIVVSLFAFLSNPAGGQVPVKNYEAEWKKVQAFVDKRLPKSALEEVKKIYALAKTEKQDAQVIKALVFMGDLQTETREEHERNSIAEIEKEITQSKEPVSSLLKSLLAGKYWNYYQQHRYQLYDRSRTVNFNKTDIATWDAEELHKKIGELYLASIKEEKLLQQIKLAPFDAIIIKGNMRHLRPTLYDMLAFRALGYFTNDERDIRKPAYAFQIDDPAAFDPAASFIKRKFTTNDSLSLQHKALLIFQRLISFHLNDTRPDALIDADIHRLEFVKEKSVHPEKNRLYFESLNQLAQKYKDHPAAAQAWFLIASFHQEQADKYNPHGDTTYRYERLKAKAILERIVQQKDSSEGKVNAFNLLNEINSKKIHFSVEKVNVPGQPFRALITYRNVNMLNLRVIRADESMIKELENQYGEKYWSILVGAKPVKSWQQTLPVTNDLQQHKVEIKIDALPAGEYFLLASPDKEMNDKRSILGARLFYVSNISYVNNSLDFFVLNRDNGRPLANAAVQVWEQKYDYNQSKNVRTRGKLYRADANGFFKMDKSTEKSGYSYSYLLEITHENEKLFMNDLVYDYYYRDPSIDEPKTTTAIFLFTDRSIYRPGQTIYFKGIVLLKNEKEKTNGVRSGYETTVILRDANYKDVDTIRVRTNEFGSFSGKFQLPETGLNGQFSIYTKKDPSQADFRVEEYKRPKFFVDYEPIKGTYKVNDKITITGFAKAYAGNNIDGALVRYRVVRQPRYIYPWISWRWWQPPSAPMEIANGEVKTDKDGKFIITFTAIPDLTVDRKFEPVFDYTIYADVTDINGETRTGEQRVSVSYKSLMLVTQIPDRLATDSLKLLSIRTQNMNGEHVRADVKVTITQLKTEKRLIRKRYWERPDQFVMSKEEYIRNFPYDEYDNETDFKTWEKMTPVYNKTDSSRTNGEWVISNGRLAPGFYMIEMETKDKNGELVKDVKFIELFDEKDNKLSRPEYLWSAAGNANVEPGETAKVVLGTGANDLFLVHYQDKSKSLGWLPTSAGYTYLQLNNEKKTFSFPATEADRGGYGVSWMFIKHNRVYQVNQSINIPWTNKNLAIEYATYRDKTLPGSEEKWKLRITGYKKEIVAAEMLASMYDASLDQFYPHGWSTPYVWASFYNIRSWDGSQNFTGVQSTQREPTPEEAFKNVDKRYDIFIFRDNTQLFYRLEGKISGVNVSRRMDNAMQNDSNPEAREENKKDGPPQANQVATGQAKDQEQETANQTVPPSGDLKIRKNFNETAFFFPDLRTDSTGAIEFSFTIPEALTKWKFMALTHTKDGSFGNSTKEIITQKDLMVQPNAPRFLREGDKMEFTSKIVNLSNKELNGQAELQLLDATTNQPVDGWFKNVIANQYFTVGAGESELVKFPIEVPYLFNKALVWRIVAKAGNYSDGEENAMPVLTNRMLVTETMPLPMRGTGTKDFTFTKLLNAGNSETLQHFALTFEYTSNPSWYAVQALPYLMEYPYECAEQTWNRYYANSLASFISNASPRIKQVFEQWKIKDTAALMSNLQKNQELKAVLLEETPWVLQAKNEAEQKKNIALLFDMVKMSSELNNSFEKLKQMQSSNGGFVWFKGGPDDRYITQYITTGIGHLKKLNGVAGGQDVKLKSILATAIPYLDRKIKEDYDYLVKSKVNLKLQHIGYIQVQYLYMRSFFPEYKIDAATQAAYDYYYKQAQDFWTSHGKFMQGMIALALHRSKDSKTPAAILASLKETSITNEELGMYWKDQRSGWFWHEAPIETHALLIETFQEVGKDTKTVDDLRTWLLKNKQTNNWRTTKATAEACYALLIQGTQWLSSEPVVEIKLGSMVINSTENKQETGTGYFKKIIDGPKVRPEMGKINVTVSSNNSNTSASWGGVYWQYFEDLDKITTASTPLKLDKKLFIEKNTDRGPVLTPVTEGGIIKVGDKVKVRVELRVDRDMEYVHMKDMRAAAMEPVNVLSSYKYQGGLGYYESTKDASTNFFFNYLRKGTYVFEYTLFATHAGNFSNGITTIQCMYAPEFTSHSEGIRINIE